MVVTNGTSTALESHDPIYFPLITVAVRKAVMKLSMKTMQCKISISTPENWLLHMGWIHQPTQ